VVGSRSYFGVDLQPHVGMSLKTETVDEHRGDFSGTDDELRARFAQHDDIMIFYNFKQMHS